jgi:hypothetical protein
VERRAIARDGRRAQALEALAFEREREGALVAQLHDVVLDEEGGRVDESAFAGMAPDDVTRVREALGAAEDGEPQEDDADEDDDADGGWAEEEIERLQEAIARCRASQHALEQYIAALDAMS